MRESSNGKGETLCLSIPVRFRASRLVHFEPPSRRGNQPPLLYNKMTFQKIPKEQWLKLSKEEKDYYTLEFNKDVEKRKRKTIIVTRGIALLCIFAMFWIGYVQLQAVNNYNEAIDKYGSNGYCYLCGEYAGKKCECQYFSIGYVVPDNYSTITAEYNAKQCLSMKKGSNGGDNRLIQDINLSDLGLE